MLTAVSRHEEWGPERLAEQVAGTGSGEHLQLLVAVPVESTDERLLQFYQEELGRALNGLQHEIAVSLVFLAMYSGSGPAQVLDEVDQGWKRVTVVYQGEEETEGDRIGRVWALGLALSLARVLQVELLWCYPGLLRAPGGLAHRWARLLLEPLQEDHARLVMPRLQKQVLDNSVGEHLVYPLLSGLANLHTGGDLSARTLAIHRSLLPRLVREWQYWHQETGEQAVEVWLLLQGLLEDIELAEVFLGEWKPNLSWVDVSRSFRETTLLAFRLFTRNYQWWEKKPAAMRTALIFGRGEDGLDTGGDMDWHVGVSHFRRGYHRYYEPLWSRIFHDEVSSQLRELGSCPDEEFNFSLPLWSQVVYESLLAFSFMEDVHRQDLADGLYPLFAGRLASFSREVQQLEQCGQKHECPQLPLPRALTRLPLQQQVGEFLYRQQEFRSRWQTRQVATRPFLPEIGYWEYIPGVPIVLPHQVQASDGTSAHVAPLFQELLEKQQEQFLTMSREVLGLGPEAETREREQAMNEFLQALEQDLDRLFPGDLHTLEGCEEYARELFGFLGQVDSFSLKPEAAAELLRQNPPRNLMTRWDYSGLEEMLQEQDPLSVLALATWVEPDIYTQRNHDLIQERLGPSDFEHSPVRPLVVDYHDYPSLSEHKEAPSFSHLTSRVVLGNLRPDSGGDFPKLRIFTTTLKNVIEAEEFGRIWSRFARDQREFGRRLVRSITGHYGMSTFSAHAFFEDHQHRLLAERLSLLARHMPPGEEECSRRLEMAARSYHVGITLPDGQFFTFCVWSWASHNFKGGQGMPTPLALIIERRWFASQLLRRCYRQVGGREEDLLLHVMQLMGEGEERQDLAVIMLNTPEMEPEDIVIRHRLPARFPASGQLQRSPHNPILTPLSGSRWESRYVLNCGALRWDGAVHIFYRAVGDDNISRIGLAISSDGHRVDQRLPDPIFSPGHETEAAGCEDPRVHILDGRIYMLYTAYDGQLAQIALASLDLEDARRGQWERWERHGLLFPGLSNKDAVFFPEKFAGKYALYHRIAPSIWVSYAPSLSVPWPREDHRIVMGARSGLMWDAVKLGAGAPPLKTRHGWLHVYHGVDYRFVYRLGVFLTALDDPARVLYRAPNPCLEPRDVFEVGVAGQSWVPNVVFTCGVVPARDGKEFLDDNDEILVYYGGADTVIALASATVGELLPRGNWSDAT